MNRKKKQIKAKSTNLSECDTSQNTKKLSHFLSLNTFL